MQQSLCDLANKQNKLTTNKSCATPNKRNCGMQLNFMKKLLSLSPNILRRLDVFFQSGKKNVVHFLMIHLNPTYAIQSPAMHKSTNGNLCFHFMHQLCTSSLNQILKISSEKLQAYSQHSVQAHSPSISKQCNFQYNTRLCYNLEGPKYSVFSIVIIQRRYAD